MRCSLPCSCSGYLGAATTFGGSGDRRSSPKLDDARHRPNGSGCPKSSVLRRWRRVGHVPLHPGALVDGDASVDEHLLNRGGDYFDDAQTENIFAYIPQQKTSLVFTPQPTSESRRRSMQSGRGNRFPEARSFRLRPPPRGGASARESLPKCAPHPWNLQGGLARGHRRRPFSDLLPVWRHTRQPRRVLPRVPEPESDSESDAWSRTSSWDATV